MQYLAKREDIIITNAEKDNAVVIMDNEHKFKGANRRFSNKTNFKIPQIDPTLQQIKMVNRRNRL